MKPLPTTLLALGVLALLGVLSALALHPDRNSEPATNPPTQGPPAETPPPPNEAGSSRHVLVDRAQAEEDEPPPITDPLGAQAIARGAVDAILADTYPTGTREPRVTVVRLEGAGPERAAAVAIIDDGEREYPITILLTRTPTGWRALEQRP